MARPPAKKACIETAALRLFASKGIVGTTVRDIASEAGVTEGALYRHYPSKSEMAWRLFCREVEAFTGPLGKILFAGDAPFDRRIRRGVRYIYAYYHDKPVELSFVLLTQHDFPGRNLLDSQRNPNDMVIRFISKAASSGTIRKVDPVLATALVMGCVLQPIVMHRYRRLRSSPVSIADKVADACLEILGGKPHDRRKT